MGTRKRVFATALILSGAMFCSSAAAQQSNPPVAQPRIDEAQLLLKARDEARPKAKAAQKRLREGGKPFDFLGFDNARSGRDQHLRIAKSAREKLAAYGEYAKVARRLERQIQDEVSQGLHPIDFSVIARFERLQAEVELAQAEGRLPVPPEKGK
jgi:hypothetical protein